MDECRDLICAKGKYELKIRLERYCCTVDF